jgi:1-acyl-sn-glycerol-3-phosphate acyltransferase
MPSPRGLLCLLLLPFHTLVLGVIAMSATLIAPRRDPTLALGRLWSRVILFTAGVSVSTRPSQRAADGPFLVISNHQSLFDIPALFVSLQFPFRVVAKRELFWIPIFGWALGLAGFIPVDRGRHDRAVASLGRAAQRLNGGLSVLMFAEGTRSADGHLRTLKKGAFHLAQQTGVPILPVTVSGSRGVMPRHRWVPRPGRIDVVIGEPLPTPARGSNPGAVLAQAAAAIAAGYTPLHRVDLDRDGSMTPSPAAGPGSGTDQPEDRCQRS